MLGFSPLASFSLASTDDNASTPGPNPTTSSVVFDPTGGAVSDSIEDIIRKHLPRSFVGRAWNAIIAALSASDQVNLDNATSAFDQLFAVSASGVYLDRVASESGIQRPAAIGMPDDTFRDLIIKLSTKKVTSHTLLEILEVFYGVDTVRAHLETGASEPFALSDGDTLNIFDGINSLDIVFSDDDFAQISAATANEVAAVIVRQAEAADLKVFAQVLSDPLTLKNKVRLYSSALGLASTLSVKRGLANNALLFPTFVTTAAYSVGSAFTITNPTPDTMRYTVTSAATPLLQVLEGDYVNISSQEFSAANRGSFTVKRVSTTWNGANFVSFFEVSNVAGIAEGPIVPAVIDTVRFYRPTRAQLLDSSGRTVVLSQGERGAVDITLPATTQAVGRDEFTAAYLPSRSLATITSVLVTGDGVAHATTDITHGLAVGDQLIIDDLWSDTTIPASLAGSVATAGNPGTTSASQLTLWSTTRSDLTARSNHAACLLTTGDVLVAGGGDPSAPTFLATASRFRLVSQAVLPSGVAQGRTQYTYNWIATAALGAGSVDHRLTALQGSFAGRALRTGGRNGATLATAQTYDATGDTWTNVPNGAMTARYAHEAVHVQDTAGESVVYIIGGLTTATTATGVIDKYTTASAGTLSTYMTESTGRFGHRAVAISPTAWVAVGGGFFSGVTPVTRTDCIGFDEATALAITIGNMSLKRMDHALVKLSDGAVMAIGGFGHNPTNETTDRVLNECEVWDSKLTYWRRAPAMRFARRYPQALVVANKVYVFGGWDASNNPVTKLEVFDIAKGQWQLAPASLTDATVAVDGVTVPWANGLIFTHGGRTSANVPSNVAQVLVPGNVIGGASINGFITVDTVPSGTSFTFSVPTGRWETATNGSALPMGAEESAIAGPYLWNPDGDPAVTGTEATLLQALAGGQQYHTLTLDDVSDFPDAPGWLALAFGTSQMVFPVKYLGKISSTQLILDYSFKFPNDIPTNSRVTLLAQKGPFVPEKPEESGSTYITGSSAGRIAAQTTLEEAAAAGRQLNITVGYPGDRGLGHAGLGVIGPRISDKVMVWGGDDLDAELAAARGE